MTTAPRRHPCLSCGACCAAYRVSFYQGEVDGCGGLVPIELVDPVSPFLVAMSGTTRAAQPRCTALAGTVGDEVRCTIYALRPSPCRELNASWEDGEPDERCERARLRHGLPPLTPADWAPAAPPPEDIPPSKRRRGRRRATPPRGPTRR